MDHEPPSDHPGELDTDAITDAIEQYPIDLAVLFGSHVRGTQHAGSDVDIGVAFDPELSPDRRLQRRIDLIVTLSIVCGTDAIDVVDFETIDPAVGASALRTGTVLVGNEHRIEEYRTKFEPGSFPEETRSERLHRFDSILERLRGQVSP